MEIRTRRGEAEARRRPRAAGMPVLVLAAALVFHLATFTGRYFHDGPIFAQIFEQGRRLYVHLAYLPAAAVVHGVLQAVGVGEPERALEVLAALSGAATAAICAALVRRTSGSAALGAWVGGVVALAPGLWFGSTQISCHVFAALGAAVGCWIAYVAPFGTRLSSFLAPLVACCFHLSNLFIGPGLLGLALAGSARRGEAVTWRRALVLAALALAGLAVNRVIISLLLSSPDVGGTLWLFAGRVLDFLANPRWTWAAFRAQLLAPYALLTLGIAAVLVPARERAPAGAAAATRRSSRFLRLAVGAGVLTGFLFAGAYVPLEGQYSIIVVPLLAVGLGLVARRVPRRVLPLAAGLLTVLHLAQAIAWFEPRRTDGDARWAARVQASIEEPAVALVHGPGRARYLMRWTDQPVVDLTAFRHASVDAVLESALQAIESALRRGVRVHLDAQVVDAPPGSGFVAEIAPRLRAALELAPADGSGMRRVVAVRD